MYATARAGLVGCGGTEKKGTGGEPRSPVRSEAASLAERTLQERYSRGELGSPATSRDFSRASRDWLLTIL